MSEQDNKKSSRGGSGVYYRVEVRRCMDGCQPLPLLENLIVDREWRTIPVQNLPGVGGVYNDILCNPLAVNDDLMTYRTAMAIAWAVLALRDGYALEVRLVRYRHEYTSSTIREGALEPFSSDLAIEPPMAAGSR
jgi:hypothetical protein